MTCTCINDECVPHKISISGVSRVDKNYKMDRGISGATQNCRSTTLNAIQNTFQNNDVTTLVPASKNENAGHFAIHSQRALFQLSHLFAICILQIRQN